jgi:glycosyltransferase involved in cell wall biosynthesis
MSEMKPLIVLTFSNASNSQIYDAIVQEYSNLGVRLECIYYGTATTPIKDFSDFLKIPTKQYVIETPADQIHSFFKTISYFIRKKPTIVIGFGQTATVIGFLASAFLPKTLRVYSRQHTSSNRSEFPVKGRIYDFLSNKLAHSIIVSNSNQLEYLVKNENVKSNKIHLCEFGFNLSEYAHPNELEIERFISKYNIDISKFVIGIVSRVQDIKGLEYSIRAIGEFLSFFPESILILANAADATQSQLKFIRDSIPERNLRIIERETQMAPVYGCMDVLIHVPIDSTVESYGLVYVEAFASALPTIITKSGVANEIAKDSFNCIVVDYCNSDQILTALKFLVSSTEFREQLGSNAQKSVEHLSLSIMQEKYRNFLIEALKRFK